MTNDTTQPEGTGPEGTQPAGTGPDGTQTGGSGQKDPTGVEGANPALDDTGSPKAGEFGEAPQAPENVEDLDLTPAGLADEPAEQEDPDSPVEPENS